jgi:hypothetical protein
MLVSLRFLYGMYSTKLPFPKFPFFMFFRWTFMMTEPSLRCRFTFLPMKDLAQFKLKLSIFSSPLHVFVRDAGPALSADGAFFALEHYVEFDVLAVAGVFPGVFTVFHFLILQLV